MKKSLVACLIGLTFCVGAHAELIDVDDYSVIDRDLVVDGGATIVYGNDVVIADENGGVGVSLANTALMAQGNRTAITTNATNIATNTANITANQTNITTNTEKIRANAEGVTANATNIASNTARIETNEVNIQNNWAKIQDVDSRLSSVDGRLSGVEKRLSDVKKTSYRGIAAVTAIANIPTVEQGKRFAVGVGVGNFEGENALAIGASIRANESLTFKVSAGKSGSSAAYGAGAALSF